MCRLSQDANRKITISWNGPRATRVRYRLFRALAIYAAFLVTAGCAWILARDLPQPPFEARNEFDRILEAELPKKGPVFAGVEAKIARASISFLRTTFPQGSPAGNLTEYFRGISGVCTAGDSTDNNLTCEYCGNKFIGTRIYQEHHYVREETLWIVDAIVKNVMEADESAPKFIDQMTLIVSLGAHRMPVDWAFEDMPADDARDCSGARFSLNNRPNFWRKDKVYESDR